MSSKHPPVPDSPSADAMPSRLAPAEPMPSHPASAEPMPSRPSSAEPMHLDEPTPEHLVDPVAALDLLGSSAGLTEVVAAFGSARTLATVVLGRPVDGGHATKPVVRLVGLLLQHPLGPSVAADALTLAHFAADLVDTTSIEHLLRHAIESDTSLRPLAPDLRDRVTEVLGFARTPALRREFLSRLWRPGGDPEEHAGAGREFPRRFDVTWSGLSQPRLTLNRLVWRGWAGFGADEESLHYVSEGGSYREWVEIPHPPVEQVLASTGAERVERLRSLDPVDLRVLAHDPRVVEESDLFELLLLEATDALLANEACPEGLRLRVTYPHDPASALLAVLAGPHSVDVARLRSWFRTADVEDVRWIAQHSPVHLCAALNWLGLLNAQSFTSGALRDVDLHDPWILRAAFCRTRDGRANHVHPLLAELQARPDVDISEAAARWCEPYPPVDDPRLALELARTATGGLRRLVPALYRTVPLDVICGRRDRRDAECVSEIPARLACRIPMVPAGARPERSGPHVYRSLSVAHCGGPFAYAPEIARLDGAVLPGHSEWTVTLPATIADLERNARRMGNCTAGYTDQIVEQAAVILILEGPGGERLNASLHNWSSDSCPASPRMWRVGEINSVGNGRDVPGWVADALHELIVAGAASLVE